MSSSRCSSSGSFPADWSWQHRHAATSLEEVERLFPGRFDLAGQDREGIARAARRYGMRATPYYLGLAAKACQTDPVWCLAVPAPAELVRQPEERDDPIGDEAPGLQPLPGLIRRYRDRVLLVPTPTCSVHCRHCFRKRMVGNPDYALGPGELRAALAWIAGEPDIHEVILTGGDPLTLADGRVLGLLRRLARIQHLWSLRIHTRMPVVNPYRITDALGDGLAGLPRPVTLVTHFNHPVELTAEAVAAVGRLTGRGIPVLNQAVLLAGVNDTAALQRNLAWALVRARVRPYALHHADLVPGTAHLRTSLRTGLDLMRDLHHTLPGHAVPRYVLDLGGAAGKVLPEQEGFHEQAIGRSPELDRGSNALAH